MSDILYLKLDRNTKVTEKDVKLSDVAKLECINSDIICRLKPMKILNINANKEEKYVFSVLKIIEMIHEIYPALEINNVGETEFIIEYIGHKKNYKALEYIKAAVVCLTVGLGAAFTIMTFNNDVSVKDVFAQIYNLVTGQESNGFTILEMSYSLGLGAGILVFYNHFGGKKSKQEPTPVQVEMRLYEQDVNTCIVENYDREDRNIDVN